LSADPVLRELIEVRKHFGLPSEALVEKDWQVVKAIAAVASVDASPFRIIFSGGTALARAHKLIRRMSEDVDFKIVLSDGLAISASARQKRLSTLRERITAALGLAGFQFDPMDERHLRVRDSSQYAIYNLPYEATGEPADELRPTIQVELTYTILRRPTVVMPVASFVAEAFGRGPELAAIECIGITETAAEKFVSLTRRTGMEIAGVSRGVDPMLVRHIHDLHVIRPHIDPPEAAALALAIAEDDAQDRKFQYAAYRTDIPGETRKALAAIQEDPVYRERYAAFSRGMVYGDQPSFEQAFVTVKELAVLFLGNR
jgi:hypothetical protein